MSADPQRAYRFTQQAHWRACLSIGIDPGAVSTHTIRPSLPFATVAQRFPSQGARAPAVAPGAQVLWHDDATDRLYRLSPGDDTPDIGPAPAAIARATRLLVTRWGVWSLRTGSLQRFELDSLTRLDVIDLSHWRAVDIAADGRDGVFVLAEREGRWQVLRVDCAGRLDVTAQLDGVRAATAFVFLRTRKRFVVLGSGSDAQLMWFDETGGTARARKSVAAMHHCFSATALGSDARDAVFLAGVDAGPGGEARVMRFDGDGTASGDIVLDRRDAPATGVAAARDAVYVTGPGGLLRFGAVQAVPDDAAELECVLLTPVLHSPDREDGRRWLRIEANATLPPGTMLSLSYASTSDRSVRDRLAKLAADDALTSSERTQRILAERGIWHAPMAFQGADGDSTTHCVAPLFDTRDPYVWVCVRIIASTGAAALPVLNELAVLYPGRTLMQYLPSIYRREEAVRDSFLRALVGVLETTTQGLDARIAALGSHVHPATAPEEWLDAMARWLGLPWDDTLAQAHKRCIVTHAQDLASQRGTRAGIETFLSCLMPERPRRFRIEDAIAQFGFAIVGGAGCEGSALPAMLGGPPRSRAELGAGARLGRMRLPCDADIGAPWRLTASVRIDIAATAEERRAWAGWLPAALAGLAPFTTRVRVRWITARALQGRRLDAGLTLEGTITPHLGDDAVTGVARLPVRGARLGATGADVGTRLL
ncbi:phage tail protein [Lysobacter sp. FW306-1B-D06B]|uniref:phage tail protein n=1 Tax=Lysobacter sp. FW306-1B-D06B TaxID=3140250 RepID=UPI003140C6A5